MVKKILIFGDLLETHNNVLSKAKSAEIISDYKNITTNESVTLSDISDNTIIMKGYIHTDDFLRKIIPIIKDIYTQKNLGKPLLTHCAVLKNKNDGQTFILTDAACIPYPSNDQRTTIVNNAIKLYRKISNNTECNISLISAGGNTNDKISPELYDWWKNNLHTFADKHINLRLEQLDVALNKKIRSCKQTIGDIADIVVCPDINTGNSIWKCLTTLTDEWLCAGILMGGEIPIILNSRGDSIESMLYSIEIATK